MHERLNDCLGQAEKKIFSGDVDGAKKELIDLLYEVPRRYPKTRRAIQKLLRDRFGLGASPLTFDLNPDPDEGLHDFTIIVFAHSRKEHLEALLTSLQRQGAMPCTEVWFDGSQGKPALQNRINDCAALARSYSPRALRCQNGGFGMRKMLFTTMREVAARSRDILVLEDDCFITTDGVQTFISALDKIRHLGDVFSVYGHHFGLEKPGEPFGRFQGWGWATTSEKWLQIQPELYALYSLSEREYLTYVETVTDELLLSRIDITPPRQPSATFTKFFAWDEALTLLCGLKNWKHLPTSERVVYNCGLGEGSSHFQNDPNGIFRAPPFNMIDLEEVKSRFL